MHSDITSSAHHYTKKKFVTITIYVFLMSRNESDDENDVRDGEKNKWH